MKIPSNRFWYVIMAGMKNDMPKTAAKMCFVYLLNFHATNWIMVPKMTNWKSAAKYQACCMHWIKNKTKHTRTFLIFQFEFSKFRNFEVIRTGSEVLKKLFMYNMFVHQLLRQAIRSASASIGQLGPFRSLYNNVALKSIMNTYTGVNLWIILQGSDAPWVWRQLSKMHYTAYRKYR